MLDSIESIARGAASGWAAALAGLRFDADCSDSDLLRLIESLEGVKDACAAAQARATHGFSERHLAGLRVGTPEDRIARRDVGSRIARARHVSPFHGNRYLELSRMLVRDLPATLNSLAAGRTTEHRATVIAQAAACLGTAHRAALDADLGPRLAGLGNSAVQGEADRIAGTLDPQAVVERHRRAVNDRRVTLRPAPDTMTYLTALLPVADGVATWAALDRHATTARAAGDPRSRGQIMADELGHRLLAGQPNTTIGCERVRPTTSGPDTDGAGAGAGGPSTGGSTGTPTGRVGDRPIETTCEIHSVKPTPGTDGAAHHPGSAPVHTHTTTDRGTAPSGPAGPATPGDNTPPGKPPTHPPSIPPVRQIDLMLVMTDRALLDGDTAPAVIPGHGTLPAALARDLLVTADQDTRVFLRRLYTDPTGTQVLTGDARGRLFPHAIRQFVLARDQRCRTPWCDATIRHIDHRQPHAAGGTTSLGNAQGLCERCSLHKADRIDVAVTSGPPPRPRSSEPWGRGSVDPDRDGDTLRTAMSSPVRGSAPRS